MSKLTHKHINRLIYVFTGEGKGKTSAALGVATRSLLNGEKVVWVSFYKQESWGLSDAKLKDKFENLEMFFVGKGFRIIKPLHQSTIKPLKIAKVGDNGNVVVDTASEDEHIQAAKAGLELVREKLQGTEPCFLLVMDEVLNAVSEGLLKAEDVLAVLNKRGHTHIVMTGRSGTGPVKILLEASDLVTECRKIKHPYDGGKLAVKGLDF